MHDRCMKESFDFIHTNYAIVIGMATSKHGRYMQLAIVLHVNNSIII